MADDVLFIDNSKLFQEAFDAAIKRALERCGMEAEGYAKDLCPTDTGLLKNSITFALSGEPAQISTYRADTTNETGSYSGIAPKSKNPTVYIGSNVEYSVYVECGTGARNTPGGRPDSWGYIDDEGRAHHTSGNPAKPYLKPAVADHKQTYRNIIKDELENA